MTKTFSENVTESATFSDNFLGGSALSEKAMAIVNAVENATYPITPQEIAAITEMKANTVRSYLRTLEKQGLVRRKHHGHYVSTQNLATFESSVVGAVAPMVHSLRLRFEGLGLEPRCWVVDYEVVRVSFQVFGNGTGLAVVDCVGDTSLDYPAFRLVIDCVFRELGSPDWASCEVSSFEWNCDFYGIRLDGVQAVTLTAFDGSFHRVYNKRFGVRDEVKVVGSRKVEDVLALMQGGVSQYNVMQFLFQLVQKVDAFAEATKQQNRATGDAVSTMQRLAEFIMKGGP